MQNVKNTKRTMKQTIFGLLILSIFLAGCGASSDSVEIPVGLRTDVITETENAVVNAAAEPVNDAVVMVAEDAMTNTNLPAVTTQSIDSADQPVHQFDAMDSAEASSVEADGLSYMREEEKLARDVYLTLYDQWGVPIFQNIASSEQTHMDSVLMLLEQYGLPDPAAGMDIGEFSAPLFQGLYRDLVAQGSLSQADALKVGTTIEELDIVDLEERIAQTDNPSIIQIYGNLLAGSENHLRAFVSNLERQTGELYQPVYLDQDAYQAIINSVAGRGNGNGNGGNGNGRRNGQGSTS